MLERGGHFQTETGGMTRDQAAAWWREEAAKEKGGRPAVEARYVNNRTVGICLHNVGSDRKRRSNECANEWYKRGSIGLA